MRKYLALALFIFGAGHAFAQAFPTNNISAGAVTSAKKSEVVAGMVEEGYSRLSSGDEEGALREVDAALQIDPKNVSAYELRGSIHIQQKLWDRAEDDYKAALAISPSTAVYKYKLAEIKFMQKLFDAARLRYLAIKDDPVLGDLATYKIILCDIFEGREEIAAGELAALNHGEKKLSYYYANALWDFTHKKIKEGDELVGTAQQTFGSAENQPYLETLIDANPVHGPEITFVTKNGDRFQQVKVVVESEGLRISTSKGWQTIPFDQMPDDLSAFPEEIRKEIVTRTQLAKAGQGVPVDGASPSFTTKTGQHYDHAKIAVSDDGLLVLTPDGWETIPFDQLPDDLSPFPEEIRKRIVRRAHAAQVVNDEDVWPSFTTKTGQHFDQARVALGDDGLQVLTPDGWITIPYNQLPDDLSAFSKEMRQRIETGRREAAQAAAEVDRVTFTTKSGKQYDQVRFTVEEDGLQVLTPDGWVTVPFADLPADLSGFPGNLRSELMSKRREAADLAEEDARPTFTTKRGKHYEQVRVFVADDGLQVLTADGWIRVPFDQLPKDLSPFPAGIIEEIRAKMQALPLTEPNRVSSAASIEHQASPNRSTPKLDPVYGSGSPNPIP
jgi:hypothetical protein